MRKRREDNTNIPSITKTTKPVMECRKKPRVSPETAAGDCDLLEALPDDIVLCILSKLNSSAASPADFFNVLITCKRLHELGLNKLVLSKSSAGMLAVKPKNWSESAHRFLKRCADSACPDACFFLGMIRFYCLGNRGSGASLMARAALAAHAASLYSLAVIQFNGSGGSKADKHLLGGAALCARAASLGHVDAIRELGHCLQDGYGVARRAAQGRRLLVQANARELIAGITEPAAVQVHPANRFLTEWFADRGVGPGLRMCSSAGCGRPETRRHEFRRCSVCGAVNYCSRACQAQDWKVRHKVECVPAEGWDQEDNGDGQFDGEADGVGVGDMEES